MHIGDGCVLNTERRVGGYEFVTGTLLLPLPLLLLSLGLLLLSRTYPLLHLLIPFFPGCQILCCWLSLVGRNSQRCDAFCLVEFLLSILTTLSSQ